MSNEKNSPAKAPRRNLVVRLGRSDYRVTGSERETDGRIMVRAVRVAGRGKLGAPIVFDVREIPAA